MIKFQGDVGLGSAHRFNTSADAPVPDQFDAEPQRNSSEERDTRRSAHFRSSRPNYHRRRAALYLHKEGTQTGRATFPRRNLLKAVAGNYMRPRAHTQDGANDASCLPGERIRRA